ncbi:hypothetical protein D3C84_1180630 [compost metagenome]
MMTAASVLVMMSAGQCATISSARCWVRDFDAPTTDSLALFMGGRSPGLNWLMSRVFRNMATALMNSGSFSAAYSWE